MRIAKYLRVTIKQSSDTRTSKDWETRANKVKYSLIPCKQYVVLTQLGSFLQQFLQLSSTVVLSQLKQKDNSMAECSLPRTSRAGVRKLTQFRNLIETILTLKQNQRSCNIIKLTVLAVIHHIYKYGVVSVHVFFWQKTR